LSLTGLRGCEQQAVQLTAIGVSSIITVEVKKTDTFEKSEKKSQRDRFFWVQADTATYIPM